MVSVSGRGHRDWCSQLRKYATTGYLPRHCQNWCSLAGQMVSSPHKTWKKKTKEVHHVQKLQNKLFENEKKRKKLLGMKQCAVDVDVCGSNLEYLIVGWVLFVDHPYLFTVVRAYLCVCSVCMFCMYVCRLYVGVWTCLGTNVSFRS